MMTVDYVHSQELECQEIDCEENGAAFPATASLFPTLSFSPIGAIKPQTEEIVWIKGTVTVSF